MSVFSDGYQDFINREQRKEGVTEETTGFFENVQAGFRNFVNEEQSISRMYVMAPQVNANFESYVQATKQQPPEQAYYIRSVSARDAEIFDRASKGDPIAERLVTRSEYRRGWEAWQWWNQAAEQYPEHVKTYGQMIENASNILAEERDKNMQVMREATGLGKVGQFVGAMGGAVVDPINVATLGFGSTVTMARGLGIGARMAELSAKGFAINAATESLIQPSVFAFKNEIGVDYKASDAVTNILLAGAGGAILGPMPEATRLTYKGFKKNVDKIATTIKNEIAIGRLKGVEPKAVIDAVRALQHNLEMSPFKEIDPSMRGVKVHLEAMEKAVNDFRDGRVPDVSDITKPIDDLIYPRWKELDEIRQAVRREVGPSVQEATAMRQELTALRQRFDEVNQRASVDKLKKQLMSEERMPAREAKKRASKQIESNRTDLNQQIKAIENALEPFGKNKDAARIQKKINRLIDEGKSADEIIDTVRRESPKLIERVEAQRAEVQKAGGSGRSSAQESEADLSGVRASNKTIKQVAEESRAENQSQKFEAYKSVEPDSRMVSKAASEKLYGDVSDSDLINSRTLKEVEQRLSESDFLIPDGEGNLVSAREVLQEASKGVDSAAQLRACFIS